MLWFLAAVIAAPILPLVVIDPGHGGSLDGAVGVCGLKEKDVTLMISLELQDVIEKSGRARAALTRYGDTNVDLEDRAAMANQAGATLFVSVHANASTTPESHGVETFFLSQKSADRRTAKLVARENEGRTLPSAAAATPLNKILKGLTANAAHIESQRFAMRLQAAMSEHLDTRGRGVLQAPFMVLLDTEMAAALVEVGFLSHADECQQLTRISHRRDVAQALATAVLAHLAQETTSLAQR